MTDEHKVEVKLPENDGNGISNILRAFILNPVAAIQIIGFIVTMALVYNGLAGSIEKVRAEDIADRKDIRAEMLTSVREMTGKLEIVLANDVNQTARIEALYGRSDTRYQAIIAKLGDNDVKLAQLGAAVDYVAKSLDGIKGRTNLGIGPPAKPYP